MLIKEYRIPLPLTVDEYRIAQLYMIMKKSQQETKGSGSGIEIIKNEPYDGPSGSGQYTYKIYHVGSHLPGWFRSILPSAALCVVEEAWNAYPYTRTKYTCPFVERFCLDIETRYFNDNGGQENVFELSGQDLRDRQIDLIDIVRDQITAHDYVREEDPTVFVSEKTNRGPLDENWVESSTEHKKPIMCAYKLCKVEFKYWGMQTKIERFIHDFALRRVMLRAHRQAWAWIDEWWGLTIEQIRSMELEAQEEINRVMQEALRANIESAVAVVIGSDENDRDGTRNDRSNLRTNIVLEDHGNGRLSPLPPSEEIYDRDRIPSDASSAKSSRRDRRRMTMTYAGSIRQSLIPTSREGSMYGMSNPMDRLEYLQNTSSDDEFYDALEDVDDEPSPSPLIKPQVRWNSVEMLAIEEVDDGEPVSPGVSESASCPISILLLVLHGGSVLDVPPSQAQNEQVKIQDVNTFRQTMNLVLHSHYPALADRIAIRVVSCPPICHQALSVLCSICPLGDLRESNAVSNREPTCCEALPVAALPLLASNMPMFDEIIWQTTSKMNQAVCDFMSSLEGTGFNGEVSIIGDAVGGMLGFEALCRSTKHPLLSRNPSAASAYSDMSPILSGMVADSVSQIIPEEAVNSDQTDTETVLEHTLHPGKSSSPAAVAKRSLASVTPSGSPPQRDYSPDEATLPEANLVPRLVNKQLVTPRSSIGAISSEDGICMGVATRRMKLIFRPINLFLFGSPVGLLLAAKRLRGVQDYLDTTKPQVRQVYNLYYSTDPCCARLEPFLFPQLSRLEPVAVPRFQRFPLGDGQSISLFDCIQRNSNFFQLQYDEKHYRKLSSESADDDDSPLCSQIFTIPDRSSQIPLHQRWWGSRRIDFALFSPQGVIALPTVGVPHLLHSSFWENCDVAAFVARQLLGGEIMTFGQNPKRRLFGREDSTISSMPIFQPSNPCEKWQRKRTSFKIKKSQANHRGNDAIFSEHDQMQVLNARFMYGPLDVVALTGEKVDVYAMPPPEQTEWTMLGTGVTDSHGRMSFGVPREHTLPIGLCPLKMIVRGDHTYLDMMCAIVPAHTESVVFSIDGSFTASVSFSGKDPRVRPGAVDVVRHWQELGYLVLYVTARPDMQQRRVMAWMAQHNFPHGLLFFTEGLSADPLRSKTEHLKKLVNEKMIKLHVAYGSTKDIAVYASAGMTSDSIFVVGRAGKKHYAHARILSDGYSAHLTELGSGELSTLSRQAQSSGKIIIRKGQFGGGLNRTPSLKRTVSHKQSKSPLVSKMSVSSMVVNVDAVSLSVSHNPRQTLAPTLSVGIKERSARSPLRMFREHSRRRKKLPLNE